MPTTAVPTLSPRGWVDDPREKFSLLIAHALESDKSQSREYLGHVTSIQGIRQAHNAQPNEFAAELQRQLTVYFARFYDEVDVDCVATDLNGEGPDGRYSMKISASARQGSEYYTMDKVLLVDPTDLSRRVVEAMRG